MANGITLSAGVRANLLSLQNTAQLMQTTQNRLATGKKVNSALDNPLNFFTSQSLHSRAGDLNALLDSMSNGIQTIQAANNGLSSITATVQSMQSTLNQALQDKSFQTASYTLGTATSGNISFSGGSVGTTPVSVNLMSAGSTVNATNAVATAGSALSAIDVGTHAATAGTFTAGAAVGTAATAASITGANQAADEIDASGGAITFDIAVDGGAAVTVTLATNGGTNSDGKYTASDITAAINGALTGASQTTSVTASFNGTHGLVLTSNSTGAGSSLTVSDGSGGASAGIGFTNGGGGSTDTGAAATTTMDLSGGSDALSFTLNVDGTNHNVTIDAAAVTAYNTANSTSLSAGALSAADLANLINAQVGSNVASNASGSLAFTSTTTGTGSNVTLTAFSQTATAGTSGLANHAIASGSAAVTGADRTFDINGQTVTLSTTGGTGGNGNYSAADIVSAINTQVGASAGVTASLNGTGHLVLTSTGTAGAADAITVNNFSSGDATSLGFAGATATANGSDATVSGGTQKTVDQLVSEINANTSLTGKVVASNDNGKLRVQNISTSGLTVTGASSTTVNGSGSSTTINGNDVRKGLVQQFNTLRDQLDKFADDSSYNGVNLLHGDNLKLTLNETGTSALNIQAKDANGNVLAINSTTLGIASSTNAEFDSDTNLNTKLDSLTKALSTLRSQASSFGSNLSVVQNRQNFTKSMINTLQTGGDNLILADTNEEGANLLALQTRQSLSTTALSLSAQADQAVLSLFG
ncbi:MAG TPA: flagellin hook IN motif-containing protein [Pseudolabrys sp.]|nr:flagellin hook IN motif-containing protein [Pseudolabrys sp.]